MPEAPDARHAQAVRAFLPEATGIRVEPLGSGHIHETCAVRCMLQGEPRDLVLQRLNTSVFPAPAQIMDNIARVTGHLRKKIIAAGHDPCRRVLHPYPHPRGGWLHDEGGACWRLFDRIAGVRSYDIVHDAAQAREAARAFGNFLRQMADLPAPRLHETLPDFHHTPRRVAALRQAVAEDRKNRSRSVAAEINFALERSDFAETAVRLLADGTIPVRTTHNDTKISNVLFDERTHEAVCVIDLDTVMPGSALYDFGDLVRCTTCRAAEDEPDLSKVRFEPDLFAALAAGFIAGAGPALHDAERQHLAMAGRLITYECGVRFLTDFLQGDAYFKTHFPEQNLNRCRTQLCLVAQMEHQEDVMQYCIQALQA